MHAKKTIQDSDESTSHSNTRHGCICRNQGKPDHEGLVFVSPACKIHYAEARIVRLKHEPELQPQDWKEPEKRPRVHYPKLAVAKR